MNSLPREFTIVAALPETATGKLARPHSEIAKT